MTSTLPGSRATRRARRDMTWRRRTRWKSSWASAEGKPVSSGGATSFSKVLAPARAHHTVLVGKYARARKRGPHTGEEGRKWNRDPSRRLYLGCSGRRPARPPERRG